LHILEGGLAYEAVVTDALDVEQPSVGRKADLAQFREIFDAPADSKVAGVIDGGLPADVPGPAGGFDAEAGHSRSLGARLLV
jgi:hypothetical protein